MVELISSLLSDSLCLLLKDFQLVGTVIEVPQVFLFITEFPENQSSDVIFVFTQEFERFPTQLVSFMRLRRAAEEAKQDIDVSSIKRRRISRISTVSGRESSEQ